jgi:hypothetical protein
MAGAGEIAVDMYSQGAIKAVSGKHEMECRYLGDATLSCIEDHLRGAAMV